MYEKTEWRNGWLYIQSVPNGEWRRATERQMIEHLLDENQSLRDQLAALREMATVPYA
jgi:hypothetical protein